MTQKTLILFSTTYPYQALHENAFLQNEIVHLREYFGRIILVPRLKTENQFSLPGGVTVENSFAGIFDGCAKKTDLVLGVLTARLLFGEFGRMWSSPNRLLSARQLAWSINRANLIKMWLSQFIANRQIDLVNTLFYTYWMGDTTFGISLLKQTIPQIKLISRAHRVDLYEELRESCYIPGRRLSLEMLDKLFLISKHGEDYMAGKYPEFSDRLAVSRLGVKNPGSLNRASKDGVFRIVSCSAIVKAKRLDRLAMALKELGGKNQSQLFQWYHFGDGELREEIGRIAWDFPPNINVNFFGKVSNEDLYKFYAENPVDLFVNVSDSEGIPVSIMEAQSCGIPILATAVGGTPEIVTNKNGWLLQADATITDISNSIGSALCELQKNDAKRKSSLETWKSRYDADVNFSHFAHVVSLI